MGDRHRVAGHFDVTAGDRERAIRTFTAGCRTVIATVGRPNHPDRVRTLSAAAARGGSRGA